MPGRFWPGKKKWPQEQGGLVCHPLPLCDASLISEDQDSLAAPDGQFNMLGAR